MCDLNIHDKLKYIGESTCPFCNKLLMEGDKATNPCCNDQNIEPNKGIQTCLNCGSTHGCVYANEYIDFHENRRRIRTKSVYHRKYHIENILNSLLVNRGIVLTYIQREQIYKVFAVIDTILHLVNGNRKRMISVNFILRRLLKMMGLQCDQIAVSKSKKTLAFYNSYWTKIMALIGDRIRTIIDA